MALPINHGAHDTIDLTTSDLEDAPLFHIRDKEIPKTWVLLDNCSTVNVCSNPALLTNIHPTNKKMRTHCQSGSVTTHLVGDYGGYPEPVWYTPGGIANVLSLAKVKQHFRIRYVSAEDDAGFDVFQPGGVKRFKESETGLLLEY